jgi:hypothetical protein
MTDSGRNLSTTAKNAIYAQATDEVFIVLLTINHEDFTDPIRVASDQFELLPLSGVRGVVSRGNEFIYLPFQIELPAQDDTGSARARISIDNVSREIVNSVRSADSALSIDIEIVLASDTDTVEMTVADFRLDRVTYDAMTVSGDLSVEYFDLEPFPAKRFTPSDFPGLF